MMWWKMICLQLTKQQDELWYAYKLNPKADSYNISVSYRVEGNLDVEKFKSIYLTIGDYFEAFKTRFIEKDGKVSQIIRDHFDGEFIYQTLNNSTDQEALDAIEALRAKPFNLEKDWLFRAILIKTNDQTHYFQFVWHHIISDGLTTIVFSEVFERLYNEGLEAIDQFKTYSLTDYLQYETSVIAKKKEETIKYWQNYLKGCQQNELAKYTYNDGEQINRQRLDIDSKALNKLLKTHKTTPFIFFNALISVFLFRCFHLTDILLSYPKNIRANEFDKIVGYFVSLYPMRVQLSPDMTFAGLLYNIKKQYKGDRNYQEIAFEEIRKALNFEIKPNISMIETCLLSQPIQLSDLTLNHLEFFYGNKITTLSFAYDKNALCYEIIYRENYIPNYFIGYFENLINQILASTDKKISEYELMSIDQKTLLYDWNKTDKPDPKDKTIHQLFEEQVKKNPNNIAIVFEREQLNYAQLNAKANQLARYIRSSNTISPDDLIALYLDKSLEMIIGILAILKSGAAYVPLDPSYPDERVKYILNDTQASLVLSQSHYISRLQAISKAPVISLESDCYENLSSDNLIPMSTANDLAYVIYTSGTTGKPKGVCIQHKALHNLIVGQQDGIKIDKLSKFLQFSSISFDASVWEIFSALSFGAQLYIISDGVKTDRKKISQYIANHQITIALLPPAMLGILSTDSMNSLQQLLTGGEACNHLIVKKWSSNTNFINAYGLTETTVCTTMHHYIHDKTSTNIGKVITNNKCYVVDIYNNLVPIGVIGELYIGGRGLARGYLNKPELTAEKFIPNQFATETDKANGYDRLYKTGDLVRWLPNGDLEYIGRHDKQLKVRGFRIELAEIEHALSNIKDIQQAIVINRVVNDEQYLFAYYTANEQINPQSILDKLTEKLPHYMVPSAALQIYEIPLTVNGKIDINALPDITFQSSQAYIEPRTEQERIVCQAFSTVLLIEKVGIDDDFFKLGGNSIKAIQLSIVLQSNLEIDVAEIFDLRTPRKLAHNKQITHDLLISKLEQIKYKYVNQQTNEHQKLNSAMSLKKAQYLSQIANMTAVKYTTKSIQNVLLTGATGFLGCNLLNQLLTLTPYQIFLCIRAKDKTHAMERMAHKYRFYFDISLEDHFSDRVVYIPCDLEKRQIGVADEQYYQLTQNIDSIIHCAALAKHFGIEQTFYSANVTSTINLLKLCELTNLKDFHYISSYSVMTGIANDNETVLTEDDQLTIDGEWSSPYTKTKYLGEINTIKWREKGINSSVYRVGNLAFMQQNGNVQEDVKDNAFATYITFIRKLGCIADNMNETEISPADITAAAMVKMFDKPELNNQTHHLFNPNKIKLSQMLSTKNHTITIVNFETFIDRLVNYLQHNDDCALIGRFLLRMEWHTDDKNGHFIGSNGSAILQNKTESVFKMIDFQWTTSSNQQLKMYIEKLNTTFNENLPQPFELKKYLANTGKFINVAQLKMLQFFKSHKKAMSLMGGLLLMAAPLIYVLELLDVIAVLQFVDTSS
ncbi:non-ribosomal peptide synthetase [Cysteiniphilum sp. QT6929]|uniref:non-ribosomal peptide synthetase n=1 Tax=Cysteiniphilum sp. QT6929 TaxID=2975055 RepID=UPI0024B3C2CA|nr:non-ribosomal peptide synthetase [Cysteiniphilum sp. QT6929]WHN64863.1 amino acid adenylation domain-containing protein [Cysteiniphilum sp. QT6929]